LPRAMSPPCSGWRWSRRRDPIPPLQGVLDRAKDRAARGPKGDLGPTPTTNPGGTSVACAAARPNGRTAEEAKGQGRWIHPFPVLNKSDCRRRARRPSAFGMVSRGSQPPASPRARQSCATRRWGSVTAARQGCSGLIAAATPALTSPGKERHSDTPNTCRANESDDAPKFLPERRAGWAEVNAFGDRCGSRRIIAVIADHPILDASVARGGWHMRDALVQSRRAGSREPPHWSHGRQRTAPGQTPCQDRWQRRSQHCLEASLFANQNAAGGQRGVGRGVSPAGRTAIPYAPPGGQAPLALDAAPTAQEGYATI